MKYFGKNSLSSFMNGFLHISCYIIILLLILTPFICAAIIVSSTSLGELILEKSASITKEDFVLISADDVKNWDMFSKWPLAVKILILPYFMAVLFSLLQIVNNSRQLFTNFANNIVFNKSNVNAISKLSKLFIFFSFLTVNISTLLVSVVLLVLCETIKDGTILKEELDFTV